MKTGPRLTFEEISNHMVQVPRTGKGRNGKPLGTESMDCSHCDFKVTRDEIDAIYGTPVGPSRFNRMLSKIRKHLRNQHDI